MTLDQWLSDQNIRPLRFAKALGVSHPTVYRLLKGTRRPSWQLAKRIEAETAGAVTVDELLGPALTDAA